MLINLITWAIFGLFVGAIARFLVPGRDAMGCLGTMAIGIVGSIVGGFLGSLVTGGLRDGFQPAGFIGAIIGGILVLLLVRQFRGPRVA